MHGIGGTVSHLMLKDYVRKARLNPKTSPPFFDLHKGLHKRYVKSEPACIFATVKLPVFILER